MTSRMTSRKECIKFLRKKGTKVAVQVGFDGDYVFVEKTDFIDIVLRKGSIRGEHFCDYDGREETVFVQGNVVHVPVGVF